jgi:hypothetical protein
MEIVICDWKMFAGDSVSAFWFKDEGLSDFDNPPEPSICAEEIVENLESGLTRCREVLGGLRKGVMKRRQGDNA